MTDKIFADRIALVTGASRGIGAATALALAARGAHVVLTARTAAGLETVEQAIHDAGGTATIAPFNLVEGDAIGRLAAAVAERWHRLDLLILNAATLGALAPVSAFDPKDIATALTLNVSAQAALLAAFDPLLRAAPQGRVVGITSRVARQTRAYWGMYGASKAAFEQLLLSYSAEISGISRVRVALIDPGATRTAMRARAYPGEDPATVKAPEIVGEAIATLLAGDFTTGHYQRIETPDDSTTAGIDTGAG